jgi:hypothetical protein
MQDVPYLSDPLFLADGEQTAASLDNGHLFMWVIVRRRYNVRGKPQATDHQILANDHLTFNALFQLFDGDGGPISVQRVYILFLSGVH